MKISIVPGYLRAWYCHVIDVIPKKDNIHIYYHGSVNEEWWAGSGNIMNMNRIHVAFCQVKDKFKDVFIFVDRRAE